MCNKSVDDFPPSLKFLPDWFVTNKMTKKLITALYADDNILYFNEDAGNVVFSCNEMVFLVCTSSIKYIGIGTFWLRKLCMRTCDSSKYFFF